MAFFFDMGRKKKNPESTSSSSAGYFNEREEIAFKNYMNETDELEKEKIYNKYLKTTFEKLVKGVMTRYQLWSKNMSVEEYTVEMLSFLHTKLKGFKFENGKKAYSYFGTIIRNEMSGNQKKERKQQIQHEHFDTVQHELEEDERFVYEISIEDIVESSDLEKYIEFVKQEMDFPYLLGREFKPNEYVVGNALLNLFSKTNIIDKIERKREQKNFCLQVLNDEAGLTHDDMLKALKTFKTLYIMFKKSK